jgi:multidrug efflux system outer membrane protein
VTFSKQRPTISRRTVFQIATAMAGVLTFGIGCGLPSVGLDYKAPSTHSPDTFGEAHHGPTTKPMVEVDLAHWWKTFHDPELDSLIARAIKNNNTYLVAQMNVRQARAQLGVSIGNEFPTLTANIGATRTQTSRNARAATGVTSTGTTGTTTTGGTGTGTTTGGAGSTGGTTSGTTGSVGTGTSGSSGVISGVNTARQVSLFQGGFDAGWEIDVFGGLRRQIANSEDNLEAQVDARRNALVTLTSEVARDYMLLRGYQLQLKLAKSNLKSEQDTLEVTISRFKAGLTADLDVAQAQASVAETAATVPSLEINVQQTVHALSILLGLEPMSLEKELYVDTTPKKAGEADPNPIPPVPPEVPVGMPSELIRRRPDVRQAERTLAAATENIGVAVANLFPKFSLTGSVGQESSRFGLIARDASTIWTIGPSVSWQILDYYQLQSLVRVANAEQQEALYNYQQTVLQSFGDVEDALVAYAKEQNRGKYLADEVAANQRAVALSTQLYDRGLGTFLDVLTAERGLFSAQSDQAVSQSNVAQDLVQLYKALGGGWDEHEEDQLHKNEDPTTPVVQK